MARRRVRTATDLGIDLDRIEARQAPQKWVFLEGCRPWERAVEDMVRAGHVPCPVCGGEPLKHSHYCLHDDRTGLDGLTPFPGLPVDTNPLADYPEPPGKRRNGRKLRGGRG